MKNCSCLLRFANRIAPLACLLAVTALLIGSWQVRAQAASSTSTSGGLKTLAGHTPPQVVSGEATSTGPYNPANKLRLVIGLEHPNLAGEEALLEELQTKGSPNFQKFLTQAEWNSRFSPSAADEQAVVDWATSQGFTVTQRYPNRLLVDLSGTVATIEKAFGVTINTYQVGSRSAYSNSADPVIPASLSTIIHSLGGLNNIQVLRPSNKGVGEPVFPDYSDGPSSAANTAVGSNAKAKRPSSTAGAKANITGGAYDPTDIYSSQAYDLNALYNQGHCCNPLNNSMVTPPSSSIAIATAGTQSGSDFAGFQAQYPYLAYHYQQYYIDGTPTCCDGEGTEDFDWSTAWSNSFGSYVDTSMIYLYDGVNNSFSTFTDVYNAIYTGGKAMVFTTSWGCEETGCTPNSVMDTDHGIFNSMVGTGMTLMAASGDQGATAGCGDAVAVQYPASDPDIVGAGGTRLSLNSSSQFLSEVAWSGGPDGCSSNDGGSTGGESSYYAKPSYQDSISGLGSNRYVPDIALNADWYYTPENIYYGGALEGNGGTSIVAPSMAGFFAQTNAYLDYVATINGGCYGETTCSPIGNGNYYLYWFGENPTYAPHYPFYDITSGCNNNDVTAYYGLGYYCTATGYDPVTGWGSINALQLARAITTYRAYYGTTTASFSGPTLSHWYNTDQETTWTVTSAGMDGYASTGVAGYTVDWDAYIYDSTTASRPPTGDSYFAGVEYPNSKTGGAYLSTAGQGCHTLQVRSWDNSGGGGYNTYGPVCYDTVPPVASASLSGTLTSGKYYSPVKVTLSATDASSGVAHTYYELDGGSQVTYSSPFTVSTVGSHTVKYWAVDVAGNVETALTSTFTIVGISSAMSTPASGAVLGSTNVKFTWTVGTGTTRTQLWLGTTGPGSSNLYASGWLAAPTTSTTVSSLPAKDVEVYATLYSTVDGVQVSNAYTYTEAGTAAAIATPANGAVLGTSNVKFTWTAGYGVTEYNLWLGTSAGGSNLYNSGWLAAPTTSATVTSLPANGATVFATLYSKVEGVQESNTYTYTETPLGVPSTLTSPTADSVLGTSNVVFTWTAGTGVTENNLWLGTSPGGSNIYTSGWLAAPTTSTTVPSIPAKGATVYATLYSKVNGVQKSTTTTYTEAP